MCILEVNNMIQTTENTTQSPAIVLKLNILQKRDNTLQAIEQYYKSGNNKRSTKQKVKANVKILFLELRAVLKRLKKWDKVKKTSDVNSFEELVELVNDHNVEKVINAFEVIDLILDEKGFCIVDIVSEESHFIYIAMGEVISYTSISSVEPDTKQE